MVCLRINAPLDFFDPFPNTLFNNCFLLSLTNGVLIFDFSVAPGGRIDRETVSAELSRLQENLTSSDDEELSNLLPHDYRTLYDPFDLAQLEYTIRICRNAKNIPEAGRQLFSVTRTQRKNRNDTDRLTKYLAKFNLSFEKFKNC